VTHRRVGAGLVVVATLAIAGCRPDVAPAEALPTIDAGWVMIPPAEMRQSGSLAHPRLAEASGAAVTTQRPGALWTLNDSGNAPDLYLIDTTGALLTTFPLLGATNTDWEEVALGPCPAGRCLYIADTGDNAERRSEVLMHRVPEPELRGMLPATLPAQQPQTLRIRYPDGPHDVEAMAVTRTGDVLLVTKGRSGGVLLFRLAASAWTAGSTIAERIDSLPIAANTGTGRLVTGMALSPDGTRLMVRTYRDLYPFAVNPDQTLRPLGKPTACDILGREPQGEAVDWLDAERLVLTSERGLMKVGTVFLVRCSI
jgi:hypothetical protein